jgi:hypothetical protein
VRDIDGDASQGEELFQAVARRGVVVYDQDIDIGHGFRSNRAARAS